TTVIVRDVQRLYKDFYRALKDIKKQIKHNKSVALTGNDYTKLHIHVDQARRAHIPRPEFAPANTVIKTSRLVVKIFTGNPQPSFENETSLPADVAKIGRKLAVVTTTTPPDAAQYHALENIGAT